MSVRHAADLYGVPKSTLQDRLTGRVQFGTTSGPNRYLTDVEEQELVSFLMGCASIGYPKTVKQIISIVQNVVHQKGISLPSQYIFFLKCCLSRDCLHPICKLHHTNQINLPTCWFPGGPPLDFIPFPIADPAYPWGSTECPKCCLNHQKLCHGHFLQPDDAFQSGCIPVRLQSF